MAKVCTQCEKENPNAANVCMFCGTRFGEVENLSEEEKLRKKLAEMQGTAELLKKALADAQQKKDSSTENMQEIKNLQKQLAALQNQSQTMQTQKNTPHPPIPPKQPFPLAVLIVGVVLLLVVGIAIGYTKFYKPWDFERKAERYYTYVASTFLRSSPQTGIDYNILRKLPYGAELIMYRKSYNWSEVKWKNLQNRESVKGYISSDFIFTKADFEVLNSIWGDDDSKEIINTAKCRIALLNYFKTNGYSGSWKVYSKPKESKPNTTYYDKISNRNSKFSDFAVIIQNTISGARKCLLFSFDDDETPHLMFEEEAPTTGDILSIKLVTNNTYRTYTITYR